MAIHQPKFESLICHDVFQRVNNCLFYLERNTNKNVLVYNANVRDGGLDSGKPVEAFWLMYEKSDVPREELTLLEKSTIYGPSVKTAPVAGKFLMDVSLLHDREFEVSMDVNGNPTVYTEISNKQRIRVSHIYAHFTPNMFGVQGVEYYELFGREGEYERIICKK